MGEKNVLKLLAVFALLALLVACTTTAPSSQPQASAPLSQPTDNLPQTGTPPAAIHQDSDEINAAYLKHYFGIELGSAPTEGSFTTAVMALQSSRGTEVAADAAAQELLGLAAVKYAVAGAGMDELALVYIPEQIDAALAGIGPVDEAYAPYLACALDMEIITPAQAKTAAENAAVTAPFANSLLMAVAEYNGTGRNYAGYSDDPATYARIMNMWSVVEMSPDPLALFSDPDLLALGTKTLMDRATTGFIITDTARHARFLPELTLQYAHDDVKHIKQMMGLLESHGIVARVQVEPKLSIYEYLPEYGYDEPTPTYEVRQVAEDFQVVYSVNCDVELEFRSPEDMDKFNRVISDYAKKNSGEEGKPLLYNAWWQPIYESMTEMDTTGGDYFMIYDHLISNGRYLLRVSTKDDIMDVLQASAPDAEITQVPIWINAAYYRYLLGEAE